MLRVCSQQCLTLFQNKRALKVKLLRRQNWLDLNKSFTARVTYERRSKEVHTTVENEMFDLLVYSAARPRNNKEKKKGQMISRKHKLIQVGTAITLLISAYSLYWSALYSLSLTEPKGIQVYLPFNIIFICEFVVNFVN